MWKDIPGYKFRYRINERAVVQKQLDDGSWFQLYPFASKNGSLVVTLMCGDGYRRHTYLKHLLADAFLGGIPKGYRVVCVNGDERDISLGNLKIIKDGRGGKFGSAPSRPVEKVDLEGNVLDTYPSISAAARCNHFDKTTVKNRCLGIAKNPYIKSDFTFRFKEE